MYPNTTHKKSADGLHICPYIGLHFLYVLPSLQPRALTTAAQISWSSYTASSIDTNEQTNKIMSVCIICSHIHLFQEHYH